MDTGILLRDVRDRDVAQEPTWTYRSDASARRVSARRYRFMSRVNRNKPNPATSPVASNNHTVNGTAINIVN